MGGGRLAEVVDSDSRAGWQPELCGQKGGRAFIIINILAGLKTH